MLLQLRPAELEAVSNYWYLKFADYWAGPFSYIEVLQMLKSRRINRSQKIRAGEDREWMELSEVHEFSQKFIDDFLGYYIPKGRSFETVRKYVRVKYSAEVMLINSKKQVVRAKCTELSAGGARIEVPADFLEPNEEVKLQFFYNPNIKLKSFTSPAKVLRLSEVNFSDTDGSVKETYSLKFENIKPKYKKMLLKVIHSKIRQLALMLRENNKDMVEPADLRLFSAQHPYLLLNP